VTGGPCGLHDPDLDESVVERAAEAVRHITSYSGINALEQELARVCRRKYAVAVINGTAGLHISLLMVGVRPGDVVLMPSMSFAGVAHAIVHAGGFPLFLDSGGVSELGLNPHKLHVFLERETFRDGGALIHRESKRRIAAIIPVHIFGHPCEISRIERLAEGYGIPLVEDATEALGSSLNGRPCGSFGQTSVLSFNGNKLVTAGGGGAILTDDDDIAKRAKHLVTTARVQHAFEIVHDQAAWNYRMPTILAAVILAQLERLPELVRRKNSLAVRYQTALFGVHGVAFHVKPPGAISNYWLCAALVDPRYPTGRVDLIEELQRRGIMSRAAFYPLNLLKHFDQSSMHNPRYAVDLWHRCLCLPSGLTLAR
jgi:perosamine synthetase